MINLDPQNCGFSVGTTTELTPEQVITIEKLQRLRPELASWPVNKLSTAWASFSEEVFVVSWLDEDIARLSTYILQSFLGYLASRATQRLNSGDTPNVHKLHQVAVDYGYC